MSSIKEMAKLWPKLKIETGKDYLLEIMHNGVLVASKKVNIENIKIDMTPEGIKAEDININFTEIK